jgi:4'-phosphopantetheinyl transferase
VQRGRARLGCDLERVEERSPGFIADHFSRSEQEFVAAGAIHDRPLRATLVWSAKEAVMKALGEGLRLAAPEVVVMPTLGPSTPSGWSTFGVSHPPEATGLGGFWRHLGPFVLTVADELEEPRLVGSPGLESWS